MKILLSPDDAPAGGAAGGDAGAPAGAEDILDGAAGAQTDDDAGGADKGGDAKDDDGAPPTSGLSRDDITQILKEAGIGRTEQPAKTDDEPQLTQEQFDKMFNVWNPNADFLNQLRHETPENALKALVALRDNIIKQSLAMAEYRVQQHLKQLDGKLSDRLGPVEQYVTEAQAQSFESEFFTKFPDLKEYEVIVDAVATKLHDAGVRGSREEIMERFATDSRTIVKQLLDKKGGQNGQPGGKGAPASKDKKMSTLLSGGQSGGGGGGGGKKGDGPAGMEVFD